MNIIIMGPPGSGKSTQARLLAQKLGALLLASGDVSRQIATEDTDEGKVVKEAVSTGGLTPDDILFRRTRKIIDSADLSKGIVFDGYPRNEQQIFLFENMLAEKGMQIDKVIAIKLSEEEALKRLLDRAAKENRVDDTPEVIKHRFAVYHERTQPIIEYYRNSGKLVEVDGHGTIDKIAKLITESL